MNILLIIKEPFIDRIPSLKTLVLALCDNGHKVTLLSSHSPRFQAITTRHTNLKEIYVNERTQRFELPTVVKLIKRVLTFSITNPIDIIVGGDLWGNVIASKVCRILHKHHVFFALEYPQITNEEHPTLAFYDKYEHDAIERASLIITHDKYHKEFFLKHFKTTAERILLLANASFTQIKDNKSKYLIEKYHLKKSDTLILHSGGLGVWFRSPELLKYASSWPEDNKLIIHTGHDIANEYQQFQVNNIIFSTTPLDNETLDNMISSADIGLAIYSEEHLGYRATLMGLAAGKIGNYLKCGIPVIASNMPSLSYLVDYKCGILINSENELEEAITTIKSSYESYRKNAFQCYNELWHPSNYIAKILNNIESLA